MDAVKPVSSPVEGVEKEAAFVTMCLRGSAGIPDRDEIADLIDRLLQSVQTLSAQASRELTRRGRAEEMIKHLQGLIVEQEAALAQALQARNYVQHKPDCELAIHSGKLAREAPFGAYWYKQPNAKVVLLWDHVCGASGYGALGDTCPACEHRGILTEGDPVRCSCGLDQCLALTRPEKD